MKDYERLDDITKNWYKPERFSPALDNRHRTLYKFLGNIEGKEILEVGFGSGELLLRLANDGAIVTGIDVSSIPVKKMQKYIEENSIEGIYIYIYQGDAEKIELDQKYDIIIMMDVLEHVKNDIKVIERCHDLLKDKGFILLDVPCDMSLWSEEDELYGHYRRYELEDLVNKFEQYGFELSDYRYSEGLFFKLKNLYKTIFRIEGTADTGGLKKYSFFNNLRVFARLFFVFDNLWTKIFRDGATLLVKFEKVS